MGLGNLFFGMASILALYILVTTGAILPLAVAAVVIFAVNYHAPHAAAVIENSPPGDGCALWTAVAPLVVLAVAVFLVLGLAAGATP